jgi:hypothetical protein
MEERLASVMDSVPTRCLAIRKDSLQTKMETFTLLTQTIVASGKFLHLTMFLQSQGVAIMDKMMALELTHHLVHLLF